MSALTQKDTLSTSRPQLPAGRQSATKNAYLTLYNFASALLWASILARTVTGLDKKAGTTYAVQGEFVKWTQTIALMEVAHSLFGE
jgi:very-long-chain (3R)-3-hydroxyacyl-CoA dehydratase